MAKRIFFVRENMLDRMNSKISRLIDDTNDTMEVFSGEFNKYERVLGNYDASNILSNIEEIKSKCSEVYEHYREIVKNLDEMEDDIRELEENLQDIRNKISDTQIDDF